MYRSLSTEAEVMFLKVVVPLVALCLAVESGMPGAPVDVDLADPGVQDALQFAVAQHNRASNDMFVSKVSRVISVQKQVVSGMKYIFTVEMARTSCRKDGVEEDCPVHSDPALASSHECKLAVWSQPWTKTIKVVENTCK
ncbi:cystatin-like [Colossoma macropomum]|uniref:cystatin-like n=1 Tax=Colossoma macropomum TaxID=42526 RepID=UPI00186550B8|nr:cystatin-like [Colossoma macropomum]